MSNVTLKGVYGDDLMIVNFARASTGKEVNALSEQDIKFIHYLAREIHIAPFFHPKLSFKITAPLFIARQWDRHRIGVSRLDDFSDISELSRRYISTEPEYYHFEEWRRKPEKSIKQGSGEPFASKMLNDHLNGIYEYANHTAKRAYLELLDREVAPEQARAVLPTATMTSWIETGSLHYWVRFCDLRSDSHAQKDIQSYAQAIAAHCEQHFPHAWPALREHAPIALHHTVKKLKDRIIQLENYINEHA